MKLAKPLLAGGIFLSTFLFPQDGIFVGKAVKWENYSEIVNFA